MQKPLIYGQKIVENTGGTRIGHAKIGGAEGEAQARFILWSLANAVPIR